MSQNMRNIAIIAHVDHGKTTEQVDYTDELLVWDFDEGKMFKARPLWIATPHTAHEYNYIRFSDGSVLKTVQDHRIFNREAGKFTSAMSSETPIGTHTLNAKGEWVTVDEKKVIKEDVVFCNIITEKHLNCFAGNVLTSTRLNNMYPIVDLKFVKDQREKIPYSKEMDIPEKWYDGLRLSEQPQNINRDQDNSFIHGDSNPLAYAKRIFLDRK